MIGWIVRVLFGCLWPPNTPPTAAASDNPANGFSANVTPAPVRRPPWLPPSRQGLPCPNCGLGLVDGECLACTHGWVCS